ncbi:MAG TPA: hypothetical protein VIW25_06395 [Nitrososphaeraceae archaeon]
MSVQIGKVVTVSSYDPITGPELPQKAIANPAHFVHMRSQSPDYAIHWLRLYRIGIIG